ncbi:MAG: AMP-binding protein, partial [Sphingomicrobium sp.]
PARSPADIAAQTEIVFSCLPSSEALADVVAGPNGLAKSARPGQIVVELGSHPVPDKERHVAPLAAKGAVFIDGEVSGTPGMVSARKAVIYLGGDAEACKKLEPVIKGFADLCLYFGPFGAASKVKLINNLLVALNIAATAEAMALGLKAGVDVDLMIKAIASGSGGSTQFGIRAPWMAQRKFHPVQGQAALLFHYFHMIEQWADETGTGTPLLDRAIELAGSKPECCIVLQRPQARASLVPGRDHDWAELLAAATPAGCVPVLATDPLYILYTSGTTGNPKGVVYTHGQTLRGFADWAAIVGLRADDRYLVINPFFHAFGLKAGILASLLRGATVFPHAVF